MNQIETICQRAKESIAKNFRHATINFIFILVFINVYQQIFGMENSIVGVVFAILMPASMARDLTAAPLRHWGVQTAVLLIMAAAACFVSNAPPYAALVVNLLMIFIILYSFTYEFVNHLYFPYILSYLFLVFISPVSPEQLPKRLVGMAAGAACVMAYQWVNGRKRIVETTRDVLTAMIDKADACIHCLLSGDGAPQNPQQLRADLCKLSKIVYERRRKALCISDASFAMIDCGRGLEHLVLQLYELEGPVTPGRAFVLRQLSKQLSLFHAFVQREASGIPPVSREALALPDTPEAERFYESLVYIREHLLKMAAPEKRNHYRKTLLSFSVRLKAALRFSPVRMIYALRVSCLLALCTLLVQLLNLPHGKWLLFTVVSVSLPYADDVGAKAKKRMAATIIGGLCSVVIFSLFPSAGVRTIVMMLSGYLSFYFVDYSATFACSTVGALGGAILMNAFGWKAVGAMVLIRFGYIIAGILIGVAANCLLFPFKRSTATSQLWKKYVSTIELLVKICHGQEADSQLYYSLVIQAHLLEDKLHQNAKDLNWEDAGTVLEKCRQAVRLAHRGNRQPLAC